MTHFKAYTKQKGESTSSSVGEGDVNYKSDNQYDESK